MKNSLGKIAGGVLLLGGTAAVCLWPKPVVPKAEPEPPRPVRSALVTKADTMPDLSFHGVVKAGSDRKLAFKHSGRIARLPVKRGQRIVKGEKVAWLVRDDFEQHLAEAEATAQRDRLTFERVEKAAGRNAVSKEELSRAETNLKRSEAALKRARTALAETVLTAPFDCLVADVPPSELDMVGPDDVIVVLLDLSRIRIDVAVPEVIVVQQKRFRCSERSAVYVTFDSAGDRRYPVTFVEYKTMAEKANQTFTATYELPAPDDLVLLPGMSATINVPGSSYVYADRPDAMAELPDAAVGVDADGSYFAWKLQPVEGRAGVFSATKRRLADCQRVKDTELVWVSGGLEPGDRVATAGVAVLTEGCPVTLLAEAAK